MMRGEEFVVAKESSLVLRKVENGKDAQSGVYWYGSGGLWVSGMGRVHARSGSGEEPHEEITASQMVVSQQRE